MRTIVKAFSVGLLMFGLFMAWLPGEIGANEKSFPVIKAKELKELMDSGEKVFLLFSLSEFIYDQGHIPGTVNIPVH